MNIVKDRKEPVYAGSTSQGSTVVYRTIANRKIAVAQMIAPDLYLVVETGTIGIDHNRVRVIRSGLAYGKREFMFTWSVTSQYTPKTRYNLYEKYWIDQIVANNQDSDPEYLESVLASRTNRKTIPALSGYERFIESLIPA